MQTHLKNIVRIFMTGLGLVLLAAAIFLNHKHPHNEGIATLPHNNIIQLELKAIAKAQAALAAAAAKPISQAKPSIAHPPNAYAPAPPTVPAAPTISAAPNLCASIDSQSFTTVTQSDDSAYQTYQQSLNDNNDNPGMNKKLYQQYLDSLDQAYQGYQKAVTTAGCTPAQAAPQPQAM